MCGSNAPKGLVHQQNAGPEQERGGNRYPLLHPAGELGRVFLLRALQAHLLQPFLGAVEAFGAGDASKLQAEGDIVNHGQVRQQRVFLVHQPAVRARFGHRLALHQHLAAGGWEVRFQAGDNAQQGGLAAAGWADDGDQFAHVRQVGDGEVNPL